MEDLRVIPRGECNHFIELDRDRPEPINGPLRVILEIAIIDSATENVHVTPTNHNNDHKVITIYKHYPRPTRCVK